MSKSRDGSRMADQSSSRSSSGERSIYRIPPYYYLHVLDQTTNVTRVETGPKTYVRNENEQYVYFISLFIYLYICVVRGEKFNSYELNYFKKTSENCFLIFFCK